MRLSSDCLQCPECPDESSDVVTWWSSLTLPSTGLRSGWELPPLLEVSISFMPRVRATSTWSWSESLMSWWRRKVPYSLTLSQIAHEAEKKDNKISTSFSAFSGTSAHLRVQWGYLKRRIQCHPQCSSDIHTDCRPSLSHQSIIGSSVCCRSEREDCHGQRPQRSLWLECMI